MTAKTARTPLTPQTVHDHGHGCSRRRAPGRAVPADGGVGPGRRCTGTADPDESTTSLKVVWHPPENTGTAHPIDSSYAVQYQGEHRPSLPLRATPESQWHGHHCRRSWGWRPTLPTTCGSRRLNGDGTGPWSFVGTGSTNKEGNSAPSFNETHRFNGRTGCG